MKIQYCSDLHLEFFENRKLIREQPLKVVGDILLLGGDIIKFSDWDKHDDFFKFCSDNFRHTYWIPGNHEYYDFDISYKCGHINEKFSENITLVNNHVEVVDDIRIIFSTLWSKISQQRAFLIQQSLNDFRVIRYKGRNFTATQYNSYHAECKKFLADTFKKKFDGKTVVLTHHLPTFMNYPAEYKNSDINEAFATELFELVEVSNADFWLYGHTHGNTPEFKIGKTSMLTNQLGYVQGGKYDGRFDFGATFEI
jgi:predicted phosphohydrolase